MGRNLNEILGTQEEMIAFQQQMYQLTVVGQNTEIQHFGILHTGIEQIVALLQQQHFKASISSETEIPLLSKKQISPSAVVFLKEMVRGRVGIIHMGHWNGQIVTLKTVEPDKAAARAALMREMQVMSLLDPHPSIITWYRGCLMPEYTVSVMEYMHKGSSFEVLKKEHIKLTPKQYKQISLDMARGLQYLHQQNILFIVMSIPVMCY